MPRPFSPSYLAGESDALRFLAADFRDPEARHRHALAASRRGSTAAAREPGAAALSSSGPLASARQAALEAQDEALPPSAARRENIAALARPGTIAVLTGQQVGLFGGPLYTVYKAASAVAMARALERETGIRCVPVFWLQTEDHDFAEIDHCTALCPRASPLRLAVTDAEHAGQDGARVSVAHRRYGADVLVALDALEGALAPLPDSAEHMALLRAHYRPGVPLPAAFAALIAALFADEGLVVFDPRRVEVARALAPFYRRALVDGEAIAALLGARGEALRAAGFEEQVRIRPRAPLLFFHRDRAEGPRYRLDPVVDEERRAWRLAAGGSAPSPGSDTEVELSALDDLLDRDPLRFSTTALLRPIAQDLLFPTVAYVGGPGELNYYAQLMPLYARFDLPEPLIAPRARFRCLEARTRQLLAEASLEVDDCARPRDELLGRLASSLVPGRPSPEALEEQLLQGFRARLGELDGLLPAFDANLSSPLARTRGTVERAVGRLASRYRRALGERDRVAVERVERLQAYLYPFGAPQERVYSLAYFAARVGWPAFKGAIFAALDDPRGGPWTGASRDLDL